MVVSLPNILKALVLILNTEKEQPSVCAWIIYIKLLEALQINVVVYTTEIPALWRLRQ
jgi:hypothetical protein